MKVLLLTDSVAFAGTERHIVDLASSLKAEGAQVEIACPPGAKLVEYAAQDQIAIVGLRSEGWRVLTAAWWLRKQLNAGRWEIVHVHNGRGALIGALARIGHCSGKLIATQHFVAPARLKRHGLMATMANWMHRWVEGKIDRIIAISEAVQAAIVERGGPAACRSQVILNGIQDPQGRVQTSPQIARANFDVDAGAPLIVCVSRLEREKSLSTLVEAIALLLPQFPTLQCLIAGSGAEKEALQGMIQSLGLMETVRLIGFQKDPHAIMAICDVFALPSLVEPFGLVIVEAMAMGKPVVAVAAGGPLEIVLQGKTGLLVPKQNSTAMASALATLLTWKDGAESMGREARAVFLDQFTAKAMAEKVLQLYRELPTPRHGRPVSDKPRQAVCTLADSVIRHKEIATLGGSDTDEE